MRVVAFLPTHHLPEESLPWMTEAQSVFDDLVIFIDERRATPGTMGRAQSVASRVESHHSKTWLDSDFAGMARSCEADWIFLIEYDEQLSPEWRQPAWRAILEDCSYTHFWCPRREIVPGGRYLKCAPWWPDFQLRLFRNNLEGTVFASRLHETIRVPGQGAHFHNLAIHHHVLWLLSRARREEKARFYEALRPGTGMGHNYLYEDYRPPQAPIPPPITLNIEREVIRMDMLSPGTISKISLSISNVPSEVRASSRFWIDARVTNHAAQPLYPAPPFPVRLSYHWLAKETGKTAVFEGERSDLLPGLETNATDVYAMAVLAPPKPGNYILQTTMVQDGVCWFENVRRDILREFEIAIT